LTASFFPEVRRESAGGSLIRGTEKVVILLQWPYNAFAWVQKRARESVPFSGDLSWPGAAKPWAGTIPEPREFTLSELSLFFKFSSLLSLLAKTMPIAKKFHQTRTLDDSLDGGWEYALAIVRFHT
jgi:hypothetical protein